MTAEPAAETGSTEAPTEAEPAETPAPASETSSAQQVPGTSPSASEATSAPETPSASEATEQQSQENFWNDLLTNNPIVKLFALIASLFLGGEQQAQTKNVLEQKGEQVQPTSAENAEDVNEQSQPTTSLASPAQRD